MSGRRQQAPRRLGLRWLVGALSVGIAVTAGAAIMATAGPAGAAPTPVTATFSVTGVSTSNCSISTGGADIYVTPGGPLVFKSSLVGITLLGVPVSVGSLAGFEGQLKIDPGKSTQKSLSLSATKGINFAGLPAGDHAFSWKATAVTALGIPLTLGLSTQAAAAGGSLNYSGTIHVTNNAADCGIAVHVPGPQISVSASPVPPIVIGVPPLKLKLPSVPVPPLPGVPGSGGGGGGGNTTSGGGVHYTPPPLTVPEQAMGGIGGRLLPDGGSASRIGVNLPQVPVANGGDPALTDAAGKARVITGSLGLAANSAPGGQLPVLLAIIAIIALSLVTATYVRLYLLRRNI